MKKKSLARVGIDNDTALLRNKRVRYQVSVFESYADKFITSCPVLNGGYTRDGQSCVPIKYTKPSLPTSLSNTTPLRTDDDPTTDDEAEYDESDCEDPGDGVDSDLDI